MLPTQFIPEYYRDSKDILYADDGTADTQEAFRPRRSLLGFVRKLLRRPGRGRREQVAAPQKRLAHR